MKARISAKKDKKQEYKNSKNMNTTENNKKIAEFIGWEFKNFKNTLYVTSEEGNVYTDLEDLKFHSSWDWLMEVVEKIEGLETNKQFLDRESFNQYQKVLSLPIYTSIEAVYKLVVTFIDWYNENGAKEN